MAMSCSYPRDAVRQLCVFVWVCCCAVRVWTGLKKDHKKIEAFVAGVRGAVVPKAAAT